MPEAACITHSRCTLPLERQTTWPAALTLFPSAHAHTQVAEAAAQMLHGGLPSALRDPQHHSSPRHQGDSNNIVSLPLRSSSSPRAQIASGGEDQMVNQQAQQPQLSDTESLPPFAVDLDSMSSARRWAIRPPAAVRSLFSTPPPFTQASGAFGSEADLRQGRFVSRDRTCNNVLEPPLPLSCSWRRPRRRSAR